MVATDCDGQPGVDPIPEQPEEYDQLVEFVTALCEGVSVTSPVMDQMPAPPSSYVMAAGIATVQDAEMVADDTPLPAKGDVAMSAGGTRPDLRVTPS